eukprot:509388-Amphidinium_carterae.1
MIESDSLIPLPSGEQHKLRECVRTIRHQIRDDLLALVASDVNDELTLLEVCCDQQSGIAQEVIKRG